MGFIDRTEKYWPFCRWSNYKSELHVAFLSMQKRNVLLMANVMQQQLSFSFNCVHSLIWQCWQWTRDLFCYFFYILLFFGLKLFGTVLFIFADWFCCKTSRFNSRIVHSSLFPPRWCYRTRDQYHHEIRTYPLSGPEDLLPIRNTT